MWSGTVEGVKAECALMNKIGEEADKRGIKFGYHNHNMEFATIPNTDKIYEDFLIANTDPDKVFFEMDVYWITVGETGKINFEAIFNQFCKNGHEDWFVEMEAKMTKEEREQSLARMEQMKKTQAQGGTMQDMMAQMAKNRSQEGKGDKPGQGAPPAGFGSQDPKVVAEQLKTSLEGIKQSADYLMKSNFVK